MNHSSVKMQSLRIFQGVWLLFWRFTLFYKQFTAWNVHKTYVRDKNRRVFLTSFGGVALLVRDGEPLQFISIHPFMSRRTGATGPGRTSRHPPPQPPSQGISRQLGTYNPSSEFWVWPGPHLSWMCLENLQREAFRRHPNQMPQPPQLTPFNAEEQQRY